MPISSGRLLYFLTMIAASLTAAVLLMPSEWSDVLFLTAGIGAFKTLDEVFPLRNRKFFLFVGLPVGVLFFVMTFSFVLF